jgi:hypothetical protein
MIKQAFGKEELESPISQRQKKARQMKIKVKSLLIIFNDIKVTVHKQFVLKGQEVNSAHYCDVFLKFGDKEVVVA